MSNQHVVFAVPSRDSAPKLGFWQSTMNANIALINAGIAQTYIAEGGDPYLAKVRNLLVTRALKNCPDMTDFFFLDDDVSFPAEAVVRLIQAPWDVVAGIYPKKTDTPDFPCELEIDPKTMRPIEMNGWFKARRVPTGFLRIKAHVLRKMAETAPTYVDGTGRGEVCWNIFEMGFAHEAQADGTDGQWWGEDYSWCRKHYERGGDIWVWPDIDFGHTGNKTWRGNFAASVALAQTGTVIHGPAGQVAFATPGQIPEGWSLTPPGPAPDVAPVEPEPVPGGDASPPALAEAAAA